MTVEVLTGLGRSNMTRSAPTVRRPPDWLSSYVIGYVVDDGSTGAGLRVRCVPNGVVVMTFDIASPPLRSLASSRAGGEVAPSPVVGIHDGVHLVHMLGRRQAVSVLLAPWGAHTVFGVSMHELANRCVGVADVIGPAARELAERLAEEPGWTRRFAVLDEMLSRWFDARPAPCAMVLQAWRRLEESAGKLRIEALAKDVGWSRRRLEIRFRNQIGLSPKKIARILRFHRAANALVDGTRRLSDIAHECGYWDQAHLNLEFQSLCGHTPVGLVNALRGTPRHAPPQTSAS